MILRSENYIQNSGERSFNFYWHVIIKIFYSFFNYINFKRIKWTKVKFKFKINNIDIYAQYPCRLNRYYHVLILIIKY